MINRGVIMRNWPCVHSYYKSITQPLHATPVSEGQHLQRLGAFLKLFRSRVIPATCHNSYAVVTHSVQVDIAQILESRFLFLFTISHSSYLLDTHCWPSLLKHEWYQISQNRKSHGCAQFGIIQHFFGGTFFSQQEQLILLLKYIP